LIRYHQAQDVKQIRGTCFLLLSVITNSFAYAFVGGVQKDISQNTSHFLCILWKKKNYPTKVVAKK